MEELKPELTKEEFIKFVEPVIQVGAFFAQEKLSLHIASLFGKL